jgi:hypothetical protein
MGLLDHQKTWRFTVRAPSAACIDAFMAAFTEGGPLIKRAKWAVARNKGGAAATYKGRVGLVAAVTTLSATASAEEAGAIGSVVRFEIVSSDDGATTCDMWLSVRGTRMGTTADARFIKPYMRVVEARLRALDPHLTVGKR